MDTCWRPPGERSCPWQSTDSAGDPFLHLRAAWQRSQRLLGQIRERLSRASLDPRIVGVAASGSLGRMEYGQHSDADLLVLVQSEEDELRTHDPFQPVQQVWQVLQPLQLRPPRSTGIYSVPAIVSLLVAPSSLGRVDEPMAVFGQRMQLLLDSQPVYGDASFSRLLDGILLRYLRGMPAGHPQWWQYLLHDLVRYYHALAVDYLGRRYHEVPHWERVLVKGGFSRLILYAGFLLLLGESTRHASGSIQWLHRQLARTPLERIELVAAADDPDGFAEIAHRYDRFLHFLHASPQSQEDRATSVSASSLTAASMLQESDLLRASLTRLLMRSRSAWHPAFFQHLVF